MVILDANMILRYLLNDNAEMSEIAETYINSGNVFVTIEVIAEVVYVLKGVYSVERGKIADVLTHFMNFVHCRDFDIVLLALKAFGENKIDFVDCILFAYHKIMNFEIATFDKKLLKLISEE